MKTIPQPILKSLRSFKFYVKAHAAAALVYSLEVHGDLREQLFRATESIVLNIAEGAAASSIPLKNKHYAQARMSAWEVSAALDCMVLRGRGCATIDEIAGLLREVDAIASALLRRR